MLLRPLRPRPLRDQILVERLEGHGIETVSPGGIIIPATSQKTVQTQADTFRARVLAMGPEAVSYFAGDLRDGDEVLLHTFHADGDKVWTGDDGGEFGLFVKPDDVICAIAPEPMTPEDRLVAVADLLGVPRDEEDDDGR